MSNRIKTIDAGITLSTDAKIFLGAVFFGFVLMVSMKYVFYVPQIITTLFISSIIIIYSVLVVKFGRMHLRLDQAGDNAYYLGLVFTLLSMSMALWDIGQQVSVQTSGTFSLAETIMGDFGLALGSTLVGIICRIILHQMRVDPADIESESRLKLAQAANQMIITLNDLSSGFGSFISTLQQKQNDYLTDMINRNKRVSDELETNLRQTLSRSIGGIENVAVKLTNSINSLSDAAEANTQALTIASTRLREIEGPTRLNRGFGTMSDKIGLISDNLSATNNQISQSIEQLRVAINSINTITQQIVTIPTAANTKTKEQQDTFIETINYVARILTRLNDSIEKLEANTAMMEVNAGRSAEAVADAEKAAVEVLDRLTTVVKKVDAAIAIDTKPSL